MLIYVLHHAIQSHVFFSFLFSSFPLFSSLFFFPFSQCQEPLWEVPPITRSWKNTWHARPFRIPPMTRSWGKDLTTQDRSGYKGPSRLAPASTPPCILPPFLLLFLFALLWILVLPAESSPALLSLNEDQLKTLTNKSPGRRYPMKGPGMKEMLLIQTLLLAFWLVW